MAREQRGARQPLSRVRPGKASGATVKGKTTAAGTRRSAVGGPPHREDAPTPRRSRDRSAASGAERAQTATKSATKPAAKQASKPAAKQAAKKAAKPAAKQAARPTTGAAPPAARRPPAASRRPPAASRRPPAPPDELYARLARAYPDAHCALDHRDAYELLAATILSAQCTDKRVNMVTPTLFAAYPTPAALAAARQEDVEEIIKSTGFFRNKAKSLVAMATAVVEQHGGAVPDEMDALVRLPGVGRKTANVVLGNVFGRDEGIVVDTHVGRLSRRLGLATDDDPVKIEAALMPLFPRDRWTMLAHLLIEHGRQICDAKKPRCGECVLADICPSAIPGP